MVPSDSQASGTFDRVTGSTEDTGMIQILTRGYTQTAEKLTVNGSTSQIVYSAGNAAQKDQGATTILPLETSLSSDSAIFPLITIAAALQDPNAPIQFVASETVNRANTYHIRIARAFTDQTVNSLLSFSSKDIWIGIDSGLPVKISYEKRAGTGSTPRIPVALFFSDYRQVNGITYPFQITKYLNGTLYMAVTISNVSFGIGLTDQDFAF